jgi:phosphoglycolate phosphatase
MLLAFDYDGVIVDSLEQILSLAIDVQQKLNLGRVPTEEDISVLESLTFEDLAKFIDIPEEKIPFFTETVFALQTKHLNVNPFPDILPVFKKLSQDNTLVVISASETETVNNTLQSSGLSPTISAVLGGDLDLTKAERILKVRRDFSAGINETFMIGDAISDIRQGKLAEVLTIAVSWGFQKRSLLEAELPDFIADAPNDLLNIIASKKK